MQTLGPCPSHIPLFSCYFYASLIKLYPTSSMLMVGKPGPHVDECGCVVCCGGFFEL